MEEHGGTGENMDDGVGFYSTRGAEWAGISPISSQDSNVRGDISTQISLLG